MPAQGTSCLDDHNSPAREAGRGGQLAELTGIGFVSSLATDTAGFLRGQLKENLAAGSEPAVEQSGPSVYHQKCRQCSSQAENAGSGAQNLESGRPAKAAALDEDFPSLQEPSDQGPTVRQVDSAASAASADSQQGIGKESGHSSSHLDRSISTASSASDSSKDMASNLSGHYSGKNEVILRLEFINAKHSKVVGILVWAGFFSGMVLLWWEFGWKLADPNNVQRHTMPTVNLVVASAALLAVLGIETKCCWRLWCCWRTGQTWKPRRLRATIIFHTEAAVLIINLGAFLANNIVLEMSSCGFFAKANVWLNIVMWSCWNTTFLINVVLIRLVNVWQPARVVSASVQRRNSLHSALNAKEAPEAGVKLFMDAPLYRQWPLAVIWVLMEVTVVCCCVAYGEGWAGDPTSGIFLHPGEPAGHCSSYLTECGLSNTQLGLVGIMIFWAVLYFVLYIYYLLKAYKFVRSAPYSDFKIANLLVRLHTRLRLEVFFAFILSILLLYLVRYQACRSFQVTWLGLTPLFVVQSFSCVCWLFISMPRNPHRQSPLLQAWLQEWAWTEAGKQKDLAKRNKGDGSSDMCTAALEREPMFCFESAINMLYWTALIYDYTEGAETSTRTSLAEGMSLYGLKDSELFWDKGSDTKMLMAWNRNTMVCSFRGTASLTNAMSDLKAWRSIHLPKRGSWRARPKVHAGFYDCWRKNGFDQAVINRIGELIQSGECDKSNLRILITGHSLGGALATLAAHSFAVRAREKGCKPEMSCYTFGAPRTGNHAWAAEYEGLVPDTWHIINDQDAVPRSGKFIHLFKRGGNRVIINTLGDLIVRPSPLEASLRQTPAGLSVGQHLLLAYLKSLRAVMHVQFTKKGLRGGKSGVVRLAEESAIVQKLLLNSDEKLTLEQLRRAERWGDLGPRVRQLQKASDSGLSSKPATFMRRISSLLGGRGGKQAALDEEAPEDAGDQDGSKVPQPSQAPAGQRATDDNPAQTLDTVVRSIAML